MIMFFLGHNDQSSHDRSSQAPVLGLNVLNEPSVTLSISLQEETGILMSHCDGILQVNVRLDVKFSGLYCGDLYACDFPSF